MTDEKREVNVDEEPKQPEEEKQEEKEEDEEVIPADPLGEDAPKVDASDSSPDETSKEEEPLKEAKPVEGETARERALRKEIERLRTEKRQASVQVIAPKDESDDTLKDLEELGYSQEEISNMEKVIDKIAEKKGYVKKSHTYQEQVNQVLSDFIEEHPAYKPQNDKDDKHWTRFQQVLASDYNIVGKNPKQIKAVFEKVHRDISDEFDDIVDEDKQLNAQKQKIHSVSHGGGTKAKSDNKKSIDPAVKAMFRDFDDEDLI
jgi:hypothetical protein